jgi:glucosamine-6-phosphate deaminase
MEKITITKDEEEFDKYAATRIILQTRIKPQSVIGLSTGKTTKNMYAVISQTHKEVKYKVSKITFLGIDEVTNVPREYAGACYTMLKTQLIDALKIPKKNFIMPPTLSDDWESACRLFQEEIEKRGGIDLLILGLGENGHLGFNQPGTPFESETYVSKMDEKLEARIRKETNAPPERPLGGLTLGIKNIMHARKIVLVAKGASKAEIVKKILCGPVTTDVPGSILQLHPNCEYLLDAEAAKYL